MNTFRRVSYSVGVQGCVFRQPEPAVKKYYSSVATDFYLTSDDSGQLHASAALTPTILLP